MLKLTKTTSPQKLFDYDCVTLYLVYVNFKNIAIISFLYVARYRELFTSENYKKKFQEKKSFREFSPKKISKKISHKTYELGEDTEYAEHGERQINVQGINHILLISYCNFE